MYIQVEYFSKGEGTPIPPPPQRKRKHLSKQQARTPPAYKHPCSADRLHRRALIGIHAATISSALWLSTQRATFSRLKTKVQNCKQQDRSRLHL